MSRLLTSAQLAEHSLRQIGVYSVYDTGADDSSLSVALERLDLLVAEMVGSNKFWWFVPSQQRVSLNAGVVTYNLNGLLTTPLQFIQHVFLLRDGKETELTQERRSFADEHTIDVLEGGPPTSVYIERNDSPLITVLPAPLAGDQLLITGQQYAENLTQSNGGIAHGFPAAWQRAIILQLSADLGSGPITRLPDNELIMLKQDAGAAFIALERFNNRENVREPRKTIPRDF